MLYILFFHDYSCPKSHICQVFWIRRTSFLERKSGRNFLTHPAEAYKMNQGVRHFLKDTYPDHPFQDPPRMGLILPSLRRMNGNL